MNNYFEQVGCRIQEFLTQKKMTQQSLADNLKVSKQVMSKIINGSKAINIVEIVAIAKALGVTVDNLLSVKTIETPSHAFNFMGKIENDNTKRKISILRDVIDEILFLEEYKDAQVGRNKKTE